MEIKLRKELITEKVLPLSEIKDNIKSIEIYGKNENVNDLIKSMELIGYDSEYPIILNQDNIIISGHRRKCAAIQFGLKEVPVKIYKYTDLLDELEDLILSNVHRVKSNSMIGKEWDILKPIIELRVKERGKEGNILGGQIGGGDRKSVEFQQLKEIEYDETFQQTRFISNVTSSNKDINIFSTKERNPTTLQRGAIIYDTSDRQLHKIETVTQKLKDPKLSIEIKESLTKILNNNADAAYKIVKEKLESNLIVPEIKTKQDSGASSEKILLELRKDARKEAQKIEYELSNKDVHGEWIVTEVQDVLKCDVVITDPPYGITNNSFDLIDIEKFTKDWLTRWNVCGADFIVSFWSQEYLWLGKQWFDECLSNYTFQQLLIWHYPNNKKPQSRQMFKQTYEPIYFYRRKDCEKEVKISSLKWDEGLTDFDCHIAATPQSNFTEIDFQQHPTQKPVSAMAWLVNSLSKPGELICDPFCGVGTTGIPAIQTKRKFYGIEINPEYIQIAKERLTKYDIQ